MRTIILTLILGLCSIQSNASHALGLSLSYKHIQGDSFEVTLDLWRYCGGSAFSGSPSQALQPTDTADVLIYCESQGALDSMELFLDYSEELSPYCPSSSYLSACNGNWTSGLLGVERYHYSSILDLGSLNQNCSEFTLISVIGTRVPGTNFINSNNPGAVAYATINVNYPENSSPQIGNLNRSPIFSDGDPIDYNWFGDDPDGDSLRWYLDTAYRDWNNVNSFIPVSYAGSYTAQQPLSSNISVNPVNGHLSFTANQTSGYTYPNHALSMLVEEYDRASGSLKGVHHLDATFIFKSGTQNNPPTTEGFNVFYGSAGMIDSNTITMCFGQDFEVNLIFEDLDSAGNLSSDSIEIHCNIDEVLPGATWTHTGGNPDTVTLEWQTGWMYWQPSPNILSRIFGIRAWDDHCSIVGESEFEIELLITPSTFLGPDLSMCLGDTVRLDAHGGDTFYWSVLQGDPITVGTNFGCANCQKPWVSVSDTTYYVVTSNLSATCGNTDTLAVYVQSPKDLSLTLSHGGIADSNVYCSTEGMDTVLATPSGGLYTGNGIDSLGSFSPQFLDPGIGNNASYWFEYFLDGVCELNDSIKVRVKGLPDATITTLGPYDDTLNFVQLQGVGAYSQEIWSGENPGNPDSNGIFNPSIVPTVWTTIYRWVNDSGCVNQDSAVIQIDPVVGQGELHFPVVHLMPNPANDFVEIVPESKLIVDLSIFDINGRVLKRVEGSHDNLRIDLKSFSAGVYLIRMELDDGSTLVRHLIKE